IVQNYAVAATIDVVLTNGEWKPAHETPPDGSGSTEPPIQTPPAEPGTIETHLTQAQPAAIVNAAIARREASRLTREQAAYLHNVTFTVSDMAGAYLGSSTPGHINVDADAAGYGWYVDANPSDDAEFGNGAGSLLYTYGNNLPAGHIDLLTTI